MLLCHRIVMTEVSNLQEQLAGWTPAQCLNHIAHLPPTVTGPDQPEIAVGADVEVDVSASHGAGTPTDDAGAQRVQASGAVSVDGGADEAKGVQPGQRGRRGREERSKSNLLAAMPAKLVPDDTYQDHIIVCGAPPELWQLIRAIRSQPFVPLNYQESPTLDMIVEGEEGSLRSWQGVILAPATKRSAR